MSVRSAFLSAALLTLPAVLLAQTPAPAASATTSATAAAAPAPAPTVHPKVGNEMELGRKYTQWLYTGQFDSLFVHMKEEMRSEMGSPDDMAAQFDQLTIDAAISPWRRCLNACVHARGAHFEHKF